jgi:ABC-2 type transport system permease protein
MRGAARYWRLFFALARFNLATELAFRTNFLVKLFVESLWLAILLLFYDRIFSNTNTIAEWNRYEYLFFVGCFYAMSGVIETFFLSNCLEFQELVRTGDLDFYLIKPIDEQFLVTARNTDWSTLPNIFMGTGVMLFALCNMPLWTEMGLADILLRCGSFAVLFVCGCVMTYSFLLVLTSTSVWFVRNQSLMELWWLFTTLMRYPRQIFVGTWASPIGWFFTFVLPVLLVVSVPATTMAKQLVEPDHWWFTALMALATVVLFFGSRRFFRYALQSYRSASS